MFNTFYHGTFRRVIVAFGTLFDDIKISTDNNKIVRVPIHYAQKEKFVEVLARHPDKTAPVKGISYPVMGYELLALNFAPERNKNPLHRIRPCGDLSTGQFTYNRVPYDIMFELYFATKSLDDSFKIAEQILPNFAPGMNIKIKDFPDMNLENNLIVDLTSSSFSVEYEDNFEDVRHIMWQLSFTVKTYLYRHVEQTEVIKKAVVNVLNGNEEDERALFSRFTALSDGTVDIKEGYEIGDNDG